MASMKELFPLHDYKKKTQKNFIKENIKNVKGCNGCLFEKKMLKMNNLQEKSKRSDSNKQLRNINSKESSIKCNVKIIKRKNSPKTSLNDKDILFEKNENEMISINQGCQTDINCQDIDNISINCQSCGQTINRRNIAQQTSLDDKQSTDKKFRKSLDLKEPQHQKKETPTNKSLNLSNYKMGIVPKYLKERNAKLELEQKEKAEQERLAELRGLNDPNCPPGHMLMPSDELKRNNQQMDAEFNALIRQLNMLPVSSDSYRVRQRKIQIEKELKELEEKMQLFKTGKVFVKISDL